MKINLALISPNQNAYSETFIQNHKKSFDANVKFYYGGHLPIFLEEEALLGLNKKERIIRYIKEKILKKKLEYSEKEKALVNSFRKHKINVVYAEYGPTGVAIMRVCKKLELPLIVNFHGYDASETDILKEYKDLYSEMFQYASKIIAVSQYMYSRLLSLGCPLEKLEYITYAPENIFFDQTPAYTENAFLAVGRFVDKKAPYYTILAFKKVVDKYPDAKLYMAGEGPLLNTCINLSHYLKIHSNVHFLGKCKHEDLMPYYTKVKGYVQHSVTASNGDMEGTPVVILEASAAALPVVSTIHAGIPDVIIDGETGLLVKEHDVEKMAEKMIWILENPQQAVKMGETGRKNIHDNYKMDMYIKSLNNLIYSYIK